MRSIAFALAVLCGLVGRPSVAAGQAEVDAAVLERAWKLGEELKSFANEDRAARLEKREDEAEARAPYNEQSEQLRLLKAELAALRKLYRSDAAALAVVDGKATATSGAKPEDVARAAELRRQVTETEARIAAATAAYKEVEKRGADELTRLKQFKARVDLDLRRLREPYLKNAAALAAIDERVLNGQGQQSAAQIAAAREAERRAKEAERVREAEERKAEEEQRAEELSAIRVEQQRAAAERVPLKSPAAGDLRTVPLSDIARESMGLLARMPRNSLVFLGVAGCLGIFGLLRLPRAWRTPRVGETDPFDLRGSAKRIEALTGVVTGLTERTSVHGSGSYERGVSISSVVHQQFILVLDDGRECPMSLTNWELPMKEGHVLSCLWAHEKGDPVPTNQGGRLLMVLNHGTNLHYVHDGHVLGAFSIGWRPVLFFLGACAAIALAMVEGVRSSGGKNAIDDLLLWGATVFAGCAIPLVFLYWVAFAVGQRRRVKIFRREIFPRLHGELAARIGASTRPAVEPGAGA